MNVDAIRSWARETLAAAGMIWKAFFRWVGLIIVAATKNPKHEARNPK